MKKSKVVLAYILNSVGVFVGVVFGFFYWRYKGCSTGSCPLTSSPYLTMIWGGVLGWVVFSFFNQKKRNEKSFKNQEDEK